MRTTLHSIHRRFEEMSNRHADRPAIRYRHGALWRELTYRELQSEVHRYAGFLASQGVGLHSPVGILTNREPDVIVTLLAILSRGGHYVPIDPAYPIARREEISDVMGLDVILPGRGVIAGRGETTESSVQPAGSAVDVAAADAAYVMFTSGSTGRPKGVRVPHRAVLRLIDEPNFMELGPSTSFLHLAPLSFDASTLEIWGPLLNGGTLVLFPDDLGVDAQTLRSVLTEGSVNSLWLTSSLFNTLVDQDASVLSSVEFALTGGEALSARHVARAVAASPTTTFINGYGPTENTTFTTCYPIPHDFAAEVGEVPIGHAIQGGWTVVVDSTMRPVADGVEGELLALGAGLATGYVGDDQLTAERFCQVETSAGVWQRCYRTGDLAIKTPEGLHCFRGRLDDQVKIEGHRIEPAEIEHAICDLPGITDCRVVPRPNGSGQLRLVAYVVGETASLQPSLRRTLPEFMVPHVVINVDAIPLTPNGKADRSQLPDPFDAVGEWRSPPRSELHETVRAIWANVLGRSAIPEDVSFFDAGGTSLDILHLLSRLDEAAQRPLESTFVFEHPTIEAQTSALEGHAVRSSAGEEDRAGRRRTSGARARSRRAR